MLRPVSHALPRQRYRPQRARHLIHRRYSPVIPALPASTAAPPFERVFSLTPPLVSLSSRPALRHRLRQHRRQLSPQQQRLAARGVVHQLLSHRVLRRAQRVALYLPTDGELDPTPLLRWLTHYGIKAYVPVLRPFCGPSLWFVRLTPETHLTHNRYALLEPAQPWSAQRANRCPAWALDIVLMPLVGFDAQGARIGMGGGFYDRTFSRQHNSKKRRPRLIGMAHDVQEVEQLPTASWDVPLDSIVTGTRYLRPMSASEPSPAGRKTKTKDRSKQCEGAQNRSTAQQCLCIAGGG